MRKKRKKRNNLSVQFQSNLIDSKKRLKLVLSANNLKEAHHRNSN